MEEKKIDKRKKYYVVLDTETCPLDKELTNVDPYNMWVYDLGFAVIDKKGNIYKECSFVIKDIFFDEKEIMNSSYYASKIPNYYQDIQQGKRKVVNFYTARQELLKTLKEYNTNIVIAHNARFDYGALTNTMRWLTKSKYRKFFPNYIEIWDTLKMANSTICKQKTYKRFCEKNGYMTKNNQVRKTAEILYRYISCEYEFVESHTGLEDVKIEKVIFTQCMRQHKKMNKKLFTN
jgi:DNA polymerase III epsilon subunit-like protein